MRFSTLAIAAAATVANAQSSSSTSSAPAGRPTDTPICDYYTTALLKNNTAENQATLLTLLVNTVVIGNCKLVSPYGEGLNHEESSNADNAFRHYAQCRCQGSWYPGQG